MDKLSPMSNIWIITAILKENLAFIAKNDEEKQSVLRKLITADVPGHGWEAQQIKD